MVNIVRVWLVRRLRENLSIVVDYAKSAESILKVVYEINTDESISTAERNTKTLHLIKGYLYSSNENIGDICENVTSQNDHNIKKVDYYNKLESLSIGLQGKVMPYLDVLEFDDIKSSKKITEPIYYLRKNNRNIDNNAPTDFLTKYEKSLVIREDSTINPTLYKILLFIAVREAIRSRTLCLLYSYRYPSEMSQYYSAEEFKNNRGTILNDAGMSHLADIELLLAELEKNNDAAYTEVNKRYISKKNPYLTFSSKGHWVIDTPATDFDTSKFISNFFKNDENISLINILREVDNYTGFSDDFRNIHIKDQKIFTPKPLVYAVLMANGCNIGIGKMAKSSGGKIKLDRLKTADDTVATIENLVKCNNALIEVIQSLKLPNIHKASKNASHTSSDGKKVTVNVDSLIAKLSFKYFGRDKGVVVNSFLDEKGAFPTMNIAPSTDREAAYMLDGIIGLSDLYDDEHMHSTDTHGVTNAIFGASIFTKVRIAPRIKNIGKQQLFGFRSKDMRKRNRHAVCPTRRVDRKIIIREWENILRIMASIKLGRCSAVQAFAHMSSSEKQNDIYKAFWELGGIIKTQHILRYFDDLDYRQKIEKQLSRVELGQKFREAIFFGRKGKFQVAESDEMHRIAMCTTILQNSIVLWNYIVLTEAILKESKKEQQSIIDSVSQGSIMCWQHVNLLGLYLFDGKFVKRIKSTYEKIQRLEV